jgi:colanic acid biosynthesis glycosyl transferase WcaI
MRILYVSPHFPPDISALSARVHDQTTRWVASGHEVHVLCGMPCHPTGVLPPAYKRKIAVNEGVDGVQVHRRWVYATPNSGTKRRSLSYASFAASTVASAATLPDVDVVISTSPQFLSGMAGSLLAYIKRLPLIVEIRDLWPLSITEMGMMDTESSTVKRLEALEEMLYKSADTLVVVSEPFRQHIADRTPGTEVDDIAVITNGVDVERFHPDNDGQALRDQLGVTGTLAIYAGTHGLAMGLTTVVEAARLVPEVTVAFIGEGAAKADVMMAAKGVPNVHFLPGQQREAMPAIYAAADACLVPLRDLDVFQTVIPSKMFEIWASGKPVILGVRGHAAAMTKASGGGIVVTPEDPAELAAALRTLAADPKAATAMGLSGRAHVMTDYNRDVLADRYLELMADTIRTADTSRRPRSWSLVRRVVQALATA